MLSLFVFIAFFLGTYIYQTSSYVHHSYHTTRPLTFYRLSDSKHQTISMSTKEPSKQTFFQKILQNISRITQAFDVDKEEQRRLRRTVFSSADWRKHRSSNRYFRELINMPRSGVFRSLFRQALFVSLCSSIMVVYNVLVELHVFRRSLPLLSFPSLPFTLTASSLGLLLVFRTNTAYSRWNSARSYWSNIAAKSFDLMRHASTYLTSSSAIQEMIAYTMAFPLTLKWHLTHRLNQKRLQTDLTSILPTSTIIEILEADRKPQYILYKMTQLIVKQQELMPTTLNHIDRALIELSYSLENCDRIYTTPIPLVYTRLTARFLLLWLITFPMSLYNEFELAKKWIVPFIVFINSMFLLGIDDLGVQIEEPFSILPLEEICYGIQLNGKMILQIVESNNNNNNSNNNSNSNNSNNNNNDQTAVASDNIIMNMTTSINDSTVTSTHMMTTNLTSFSDCNTSIILNNHTNNNHHNNNNNNNNNNNATITTHTIALPL
jgi:ion channel-forming bestrophin family protein